MALRNRKWRGRLEVFKGPPLNAEEHIVVVGDLAARSAIFTLDSSASPVALDGSTLTQKPLPMQRNLVAVEDMSANVFAAESHYVNICM